MELSSFGDPGCVPQPFAGVTREYSCLWTAAGTESDAQPADRLPDSLGLPTGKMICLCAKVSC